MLCGVVELVFACMEAMIARLEAMTACLKRLVGGVELVGCDDGEGEYAQR